MNWMTILWPIMVGACTTLALISLRIAFGDGWRLPHLFFSLCAFAVAAISGFELALMQTNDLVSYEATLRWAVIPIFIMVASVVGFIWTFFGTGRIWLALPALVLNGASQVANLVLPTPAVRHAVALHQEETLGGVHYTVPEIVNGPWNIVEFISVALLLAYILDASLALWKQGERRRAVIVGGGLFLFLLIARGHATLIECGWIQTPYLVSFSFVWVLIAMGYELSEEVLRAAHLSQKLRESEQRMNLAAEAGRLGMWVWDVGRDTVWVTDLGRSLFGFGQNQHLNYAAFAGRVHPEDRPSRDGILTQTLETLAPYSMEYRVVLPDGSRRWISSRGHCVDAGNGRDRRLMGVLMDISAQKEAEFELQRQREEMAHMSRVSTMGQLASALAHELNQPLGAILRNAEAAGIFLKSDQPDLDELRAIIEDIRKDDERAGQVIDRLRALLKRRKFESVPLPAAELLNDVATLARPDAAARQVILEIDTTEEEPRVQADRIQIQQVLLNLVLNAMDAMDRAPAGRKCVTLSAKNDGRRQVEITVRDTGPGIDPEKLALVFEPFFTTREHGMGMGLSISRTIVEAHGGTIRAENNVGGGATFRFSLSAAREEATI